MPTVSPRAIAILQVLLSGVAFGTLGVFGKLAFSAGLSPGEFLAFRFVIASTILVAFVAIFRPRDFTALNRRSIAACLLLGVLGYAVFSSCYFMALERISASLTVLLLYTYPALVAVGAYLLFGERVGRRSFVGIVLACAGLTLLVGTDVAVRNPSGVLYGLGSAIVYALYILGTSRWLRGVPPLAASALIQASAGLTLFCVHLASNTRVGEMFVENWLLILATALIATVLAMSLFIIGLQKLRSSEVSLLSMMEPISAVVLAVIFLDESLAGSQVLGGILVVGALVFSGRGRREIPAGETE